jgi:hypothetical protein
MVMGVAVMLALVVGGASTALAGTGVGAVFNLGQANTVNAVSKLVGSVDGPSLQIDNNSTGAGGTGGVTALDLQVESGKPPLKVNSGTKVANLNADTVDGKDSTDFVTPNSTLKSGQTLAGVWATASPGTGTETEIATEAIEFRPKLAAAIPASNVHYVTSTNSTCPGKGQAAAGHLCVYQTQNISMTFEGIANPSSTTFSRGADQLGAAIYFDANSRQSNARGTWAVTAP